MGHVIWDLEPGTWDPVPGNWILGRGILNLKPGTGDLELLGNVTWKPEPGAWDPVPEPGILGP